jgi:23S rRNA (guanosine2251-2'-O)-methyltransferase
MKREVYIILDNIRSAYNVGSAFRTADAAGVKKIYICGISPYPPHTQLAKTALGATFFVPWEYTKTTEEAVEKLQKENIPIFAVENGVDRTENYKNIKYPEKVAFIFGNEVDGIKPELIEKSDKVIDIPMLGKKNSLNVATTIGIILYHLV